MQKRGSRWRTFVAAAFTATLAPTKLVAIIFEERRLFWARPSRGLLKEPFAAAPVPHRPGVHTALAQACHRCAGAVRREHQAPG